MKTTKYMIKYSTINYEPFFKEKKFIRFAKDTHELLETTNELCCNGYVITRIEEFESENTTLDLMDDDEQVYYEMVD